MNSTKPLLLSTCFSLLLVLGFYTKLNAQISISPQLISTTGNYSSAGGISLSASVGEAQVQTFFSSTHVLTQGFQQPGANSLSFTVNSLNATCVGANNGFAEVQLKSGRGPFSYLWQPGGATTADAKDLSPGQYVVEVKDARGFTLRDTILIALDFEGACGIHIYNGFTPNGDNRNDSWVIDGIEEFPNNNVYIFNRWGDKVWEQSNYDNSNVVWQGTNLKEEKLPDGTYFYLVSIDSKKYKGWVEITR
jgi:gliding motility-associated-like protein